MPSRVHNNHASSPYRVGALVKEDGWYVCVPCGLKKYFKKEQHFSRCLKCVKNQGYAQGLELWEKVDNG